jgi:aspartate/methionine/tyrosine aminotransferase
MDKMKSLVADRIQDISPFYVMELLRRAKTLEQQGRDIIHLEVGEPDFPTPDSVLRAGAKILQQGDIKYTPAAGLPALREAIADYYLQHYQVKLDAGRVFITPGASGAFLLALGASLNPGETVLMADPCYPCNRNFVHLYGGLPKAINVSSKTAYQLTASLIKQNWDESSKGILIASPSNPTGTVISPNALQQVIEQTRALGGCFYSDEIYHGLVYGEKAASALQYSDDVFVINSFSKFFGMTGWRIGWLIVPEAFINAVEKLAQNLFIATPTQSQFAALASFADENMAELEQRRQAFEKRRDFLYQGLQTLGFELTEKPQGAFYLYADCSRFTDDSFQFAKALLEQEGVAVTPGKDFGENQANTHIRFAYTVSIDKISAALIRLERFICQYNK